MKNQGVFRAILFDFMNVIAECTLSVAVIGSIFAGSIQITYHYFFIPIILGIFYMLPCIPTYFKEDMTVKQVIIQRIIELVILEAATIFAAYLLIGSVLNTAGYIVVGISVVFFDALTYFLSWINEKNTADKINKIISERRSGGKDKKE